MSQSSASYPSEDTLLHQIDLILRTHEASSTTPKFIREEIEKSLHLPVNSLHPIKQQINTLIARQLQEMNTTHGEEKQQVIHHEEENNNNGNDSNNNDRQRQSSSSSSNTAAAKRQRIDDSDADSDDDNRKPAVRRSDEEFYIDLGGQKRITVSKYKGKLLINIREYYSDDGVMKPGKRGITLNPDQWEKLVKGRSKVDREIEAQR